MMTRADHSCPRLCHIGKVANDSPFRLVRHLAQASPLGWHQIDISKGQVGWWENHKDVGWRGCLKAYWPTCSDKDYRQHSLISATALSNQILRISQKEDSQLFCVTLVSAHTTSWWKIFLHYIQPKLFKLQFTTIVPWSTYKNIFCHCKELFCFISFCGLSSRCHRLLLDHNLAPTSLDETSPDPSAYAHRSCTQGLWTSWWSSCQFLMIPFDLESPEWDVSFQAGSHIHQLRRKAASFDLLTVFLLMMLVLSKLRTENIYTALESPTGFV